MSIHVGSIALLRALDYNIGSQSVLLLGHNTPGDNGGGDFYFDAASNDADNGGTVIKPNSVPTGNSGRWKRIFFGAISIKWFGAYGDGLDHGANERNAIKAAIEYAETKAASVYVPAGIYRISGPIIVRSNMRLYGDGPNSIIYNSGTGSPHGNCIHIGVGYEYENWNGDYGTGAVIDARLNDFNGPSPNYSRITTRNTIVENLCVKGKDRDNGGLGIWVMNASDVTINNVWSDECATPINIGNDSGNSTCASRNVSVNNIFVIRSGKWYDLVFIGEAENVTLSNCFNNPLSLAILNEMIVSIEGRNLIISNCHLKSKKPNTKIGVSVGAYLESTPTNCSINSNIIEDLERGIVLFRAQENSVGGNRFINVNTGVQTYSKQNIISSNVFNNVVKSILIETNANTGVLIGNIGIDSNNISDLHNLLRYWKLNGNYPYFNASIPIGMPFNKRYNPVECFLDYAALQRVLELNAILRCSGVGPLTIYYKLPDTTVKISAISINWYSNTIGESINFAIVSQDIGAGHLNNFSYLFTGTLQQSTSIGDKYYSATPNVTANLGSSLYIQLTISFNSNYSQLRDLVANTSIVS